MTNYIESSAPNIAHAAYQASGRPGIEARTREVREALRQSAALVVVERAQQDVESQG